LFLKYGGDGINRVACFKLLGEGMIKQYGPGLDFIVLESRVEEALEGGHQNGLTHMIVSEIVWLKKEEWSVDRTEGGW
jgi:hypothetical protein